MVVFCVGILRRHSIKIRWLAFQRMSRGPVFSPPAVRELGCLASPSLRSSAPLSSASPSAGAGSGSSPAQIPWVIAGFSACLTTAVAYHCKPRSAGCVATRSLFGREITPPFYIPSPSSPPPPNPPSNPSLLFPCFPSLHLPHLLLRQHPNPSPQPPIPAKPLPLHLRDSLHSSHNSKVHLLKSTPASSAVLSSTTHPSPPPSYHAPPSPPSVTSNIPIASNKYPNPPSSTTNHAMIPLPGHQPRGGPPLI